ncbi:MAG: transporter substrate-binding domain-containing protein, partial [Planctomycetia bacterium]|nr:transporter substrate-binding domain-containing protein [Planctomycetia bacterium]
MKNSLRTKSGPVTGTLCSKFTHVPLCCALIFSIFFVCCLFNAPFVLAQAEKPAAQAAKKDAPESKTSGKDTEHGFWQIVKVGFFPFAGYHDVDKLGHRSGFGYDYLHNLRRYTTWGFDYSDPVYKWPDMLSMLEEGKIDILTNVQKTPEREKRVAFSRNPMGEVAMVLSVKAGCTKYRQGDYKNWSGMRIGVVRDSELNTALDKFALEKGFTFTPVYYDDSARMLDDLQQDKVIDAVYTSDLRRLHNEWVYDEIGVSPCYIAVNKNKKELLDELDRAMLQLETQSPDLRRNLRSKYFSEVRGSQIAYTAEEHEFINESNATGRTFTAILSPGRRPL